MDNSTFFYGWKPAFSGMASDSEICQVFDNLSLNFSYLSNGRSEKQQQYIHSLLNELNALNYKLPVVTNNNKAVLLIHQICSIVAPSDVDATEKCCVLIVNLITQQHVKIEGRSLSFAVQWIIQIFKQTGSTNIATLQCLESLIRDNVDKIQELLPELLGNQGILLKFLTINTSQDVKFRAIKCLEAICYNDELNSKPSQIDSVYLETCCKIFLQFLIEEHNPKCDIINCKLIISSLRGLQSIITQNTGVDFDLGILLGVAKCYTTYYLYESSWIKPKKMMPSNLSVADLNPNVSREKKGGKMTKQRKQRKSNNHKKEETKRTEVKMNNSFDDSGYTPATSIPENPNIVISDSDYSDSESGRVNKIAVTQGRVRQAALNLLISIIKVTDKHVMFGYWSNFFSDGAPSGAYSLNHCLLQEPSPRGRIAVLNVISTILNGSKLYLSQAETSEKTFAFTPFSMILGSMIQQLHKCLCAALKDNSIPIITQTLKCLALLVQATPYHRLSPGLISDVISNVKLFIRHRDTSVQVAGLIVLGCVVASEPTVPETIKNLCQIKEKHVNLSTVPSNKSDHEIEYADFSSDEEDPQTLDTETNLPWLLEKCLRNLGVINNKNSVRHSQQNNIVPAPVKLESLQVISVMCRNYFKTLLAPYILLVAKSLEISLTDKYMDLRLHAGRAVDSIGHSMQLHVSTTDEPKSTTIEKCLQFWQILLNGPLTSLLQSDLHLALRSIGCDCLGSIGPDIFEHLPKAKQLLIISLLFSCSRDEENSIRGAAVRALAISVLYPSLREDLGFIMDTAEAIIRTLNDSNLTVKTKSSWSLGNLSDALVLYQATPSNEDLPNILIYKLLSASISAAESNNKIKCNAIRALGNLLRLVSTELLLEDDYKVVVEKAIEILVINSTNCVDMKVRWNSCYAIGNFMKNNNIFVESINWQQSVYTALMDLVVNFRNFKVRINAALAFSVPEKRNHYSEYYFPILKSLLNALDNSQHMEDYNEFKHRDNLVDQICISIAHLITFLTKEDLNTFHEILIYHSDALKTQMNRVHLRLVPEKSDIFLKAVDHITKLQGKSLTKDENSVIELLKNIFENREELLFL